MTPKHHEIEIGGRIKNLKEWCREFGISYTTCHQRVANGWPVEKALRTPVSATGRGVDREKDDFYPTPDWLIDAILPHVIRWPCGKILEPACGDGAIVKRIKHFYGDMDITSMDITRRNFPCIEQDFLTAEPDPNFDIIITNPPYSLAQEFVTAALKWRRHYTSKVVMLFRLNFVEGQKRSKWMKENLPDRILVTPRRPSFRKGGNDNCAYAWWVWDNSSEDHSAALELLDTALDKYK